MTCIVGLVDNGKVYIGGDSAGTNSSLDKTIRKDPKVFRVKDYLVGFTSSFRMGQILMCDFNPPVPYPDEKDDQYRFMVRKFVPSVRHALKDGGFARTFNDEEVGGTFLVGCYGRLFEIGSDYQVGESHCQYDAVGCGQGIAKGALFATQGMDVSPEQRIETALKAAAEHSAGVAGPFVIMSDPEEYQHAAT